VRAAPTPYGHDTGVFARRFAGFGWRIIEIDGHDMVAIVAALQAAHDDGPTAILARTVKGKGVSFLEGAEGWHGKPFSAAAMPACRSARTAPRRWASRT
jgi:transketolase